ncbi:hypothetical protein [Paenibacillus puldeungensis]|uniref:hypothetical protein n=1 Tax=Paenibacillus puldeungensis TaxID=696536 RepID=UPI0036D33DFE
MKKTLLFIILVVLLCASCTNNHEIKVTHEDIDDISLTLDSKSESSNGLNFVLKLQNNSRYIIKQNNVNLSFPIKIDNGTKGNDFKIESKGNKLDIHPGEELFLTVFAPMEMYEGNNNIDLDNPYIEINGYINEVEGIMHFHKGGGYKTMEDF